MTDTINLVKEKAEKVTISLKKKGVTKVPTLRVAAAYDVSGSMSSLYRNGIVQKAADQVLGVAYKFDDDGQVDSFIFDSRAAYVGTSTTDDFGTFVANTILNRSDLWASTVYGTCLNLIMDFMFGAGVKSTINVPAKKGLFGFGKPTTKTETFKSAGNDPVLVLFFTDGSPDDGMRDSAFRIIKDAQDKKKPIYFNLIGIGGANFAVLKKLADDYDNCGFVSLADINMTDEKLYDALVGTEEFIDFIKLHGAS